MLASLSAEDTAAQRNLLVIEDDLELLSVLKFVLRHYGEVHGAASVSEARGILRRVTPDLIVSDVGLSDGNGVEFVNAFPGVPVILISGIPRVEDELEGLEFFQFVPKPVATERIRELVGAALAAKVNREARAQVAEAIEQCERLSGELNDTIARLKKLYRLF